MKTERRDDAHGERYIISDERGYGSLTRIQRLGPDRGTWAYLLVYVPCGWAWRCIHQGLLLANAGEDVVAAAAARTDLELTNISAAAII
jgi:hypothetical protein